MQVSRPCGVRPEQCLAEEQPDTRSVSARHYCEQTLVTSLQTALSLYFAIFDPVNPKLGHHSACCCLLPHCLLSISPTLMTVAVCSYETLLNSCNKTWRLIPEDSTRRGHCFQGSQRQSVITLASKQKYGGAVYALVRYITSR